MDLAAGERAIYPSGSPFAGSQMLLLALSKLLRGIGLFLAFDLLRVLPAVHLQLAVRLGAGLVFAVLQKPLNTSAGPRLQSGHWWRIARHATVSVLLEMLWLSGLSLCGPLRFILLYEHADAVVLAAASALYAGTGGPSKTRGAVFFLLGVLGLLFLDHDAADGLAEHPEGAHNSALSHGVYSLVGWLGLADHKAGVLLLTLALCLTSGFNQMAKTLAVTVGGAKRLHVLSTLLGAVLLLPWSLYVYITQEILVDSPLHQILALVFVVLIVFVLDYYVTALSVVKLGALPTARYSSLILSAAGLMLALLWNHPYTTSQTTVHKVIQAVAGEHKLSGGLWVSFLLICYSVTLLTGATRPGSRAGNFIGYSEGGLPLYMTGGGQAGHALQRTGQSILQISRAGLTQILADRDSRAIFYFLCLNLTFTGVELVYGAWTNSLGLISDGFHMLFDCSALVMGLYAAVMAKWKPTRVFTFGYDRVEVLSGFVNGLFLVVIATFVILSAIGRIFDPPAINTDRLMVVSVGGLLVNLVGLCAFRHAHSHGGGGSHTHGHSHGHEHGHSHNHGHSHGDTCADSHSHENTNMQGVFLHVVADTLGSLGVIFSSFLISRFGLLIADPICSMFIAVLIILSVTPLLRDTVSILALGTPPDTVQPLRRLTELEGVLSVRNPHFWWHTSAVRAAALHLLVTDDSVEQRVLTQARRVLKSAGFSHVTVQVEKDAFHQHMGAMRITVESNMMVDQHSFVPKLVVHSL